MLKEIIKEYQQIGDCLKKNPLENKDAITQRFVELFYKCWSFLSSADRRDLVSKIDDKSYFSFKLNDKHSRAVNKDLIIDDPNVIRSVIELIIKKDFGSTNSIELTRVLYTIAISFCTTIDLLKQRDQKTPGTYFEYFARHLFSHMLDLEPRNRVDVLNLDMKTSLPTDFIYDLGANRPKIHLPVKTSTRERVIQVWAHQRVLDGVYGTGRFLGMLVCLSETKVDHKSFEVVEICLPNQWRLYQMFIAQMHRVYYLDTPTQYYELNDIFPPIAVRPFGEFFYEIKNLMENNKIT